MTNGSRGGVQALTPRPFQPSQVVMGSKTVDPRIFGALLTIDLNLCKGRRVDSTTS
jgi:hypothetical protein